MGLPVFRSGGFSVGCSAGLSTCAAATHAQRKPAPNAIESLMLPELYRVPNVRKNTSLVSPVTLFDGPSSSRQIPVTISGRTPPFHPNAPAFNEARVIQ